MAKKAKRMETPVLITDMVRWYFVSKYVRNSWRVLSHTSISRLSDTVHAYSSSLTMAAVAADGEGSLNVMKGTDRLTKPFL